MTLSPVMFAEGELLPVPRPHIVPHQNTCKGLLEIAKRRIRVLKMLPLLLALIVAVPRRGHTVVAKGQVEGNNVRDRSPLPRGTPAQ